MPRSCPEQSGAEVKAKGGAAGARVALAKTTAPVGRRSSMTPSRGENEMQTWLKCWVRTPPAAVPTSRAGH